MDENEVDNDDDHHDDPGVLVDDASENDVDSSHYCGVWCSSDEGLDCCLSSFFPCRPPCLTRVSGSVTMIIANQ